MCYTFCIILSQLNFFPPVALVATSATRSHCGRKRFVSPFWARTRITLILKIKHNKVLDCLILHIWASTLAVAYDEVSDRMYNWVAERPDFKSALRVVKMVLNTQCYQYLWLKMWFHAKKSKETLKQSKSLIVLCKFGSRPQKWPKIAKKRIT